MFSLVKPTRPITMKVKNSRMTSGRRCRKKATIWRMAGVPAGVGAACRRPLHIIPETWSRPVAGRGAGAVDPGGAVDEQGAAGDHVLTRLQPVQHLDHVAAADAGLHLTQDEAVAVERDPDTGLGAAIDQRVHRHRDGPLLVADRD